MAHFYGQVTGARRPATRCGTRNSGMTARARGWNIGGRVEAEHRDGQDQVEFLLDRGSNGEGQASISLGVITQHDLNRIQAGTHQLEQAKVTPVRPPHEDD